MTRLQKRFREKIVIAESGCWLWQGHVMKNGYGQAWNGTRVTTAHRAVYESVFGPLPHSRIVLDHQCRTPRCVNPDHLRPCLDGENSNAATLAARTHCPRGHLFSPDNTYRNPAGRGRTCLTCRATYMKPYSRRYYREHPEKWQTRRSS